MITASQRRSWENLTDVLPLAEVAQSPDSKAAYARLHDLNPTIPADEIVTIPSRWTMCPASLPVRFTGTS